MLEMGAEPIGMRKCDATSLQPDNCTEIQSEGRKVFLDCQVTEPTFNGSDSYYLADFLGFFFFFLIIGETIRVNLA